MATTWYLDIRDQQPPFDAGVLDGQNRAMWTFNIIATKQPSSTFLIELIKILEDAGVGTYGTDIFISTKANIPPHGGPYLNIVATGGAEGIRIQNDVSGPAYERPSAQITVRALSAAAAEAMCRAAYAALVGIRNQTITTV